MPRAPIPRGDVARRSHETHQVHEFIGQKILTEAEEVAKAHGVEEVARVIADGDPATRILGTADKEKVDMIVMGSRGFGTLKGLMLGSVSQKVSHLANCTVACAR